MYHRKNIDLCLSKEFFHLSNIEDEKTKIKCLSEFFHLDIDSFRYSDYEITYLSDNPITITVKDNKTLKCYCATYDNAAPLLKAQAEHIKFINVNIQYSNGIERERVFYRFMDNFDFDPLHDEIYIMFDDHYRLTLTKKYSAWYRPIEGGIYLTLSDTRHYTTVFHTKIFKKDTEFFENRDVRAFSFEHFVQDFIENKDKIFNKIMSKLDVKED